MSMWDSLAIDEKKANEGVWFDDLVKPNPDGSQPGFRLAHKGRVNKAYKAELNRAMKRYKRQIDADTLSDEKSDEIMQRIFAKTVLLEWRNVQDRDGAPIPYSVDNALMLFAKLPRLYDVLDATADSEAEYNATVEEGEAGN